MEGPSIFLAAEQLAPFVNKKIEKVDGNTKIGKERLLGKKILDIFSWGKHLVFQFDEFALRVHFLLFGSFEATVDQHSVTGDYSKKNRVPRLALNFENGHIEMYSCSLLYLEYLNAKETYDFSIDVMSSSWDSKEALKKVLKHPNSEIGDILLDQSIFAGVGNIIKNEVLFLVNKSPESTINEISVKKLRELIKKVREFVFQFYEWRKAFVLKKYYQIYRKGKCIRCNEKIVRKRTGLRQRISFFCPKCQN